MDILTIQDRIHSWMARRYTRLAARSFADFGDGSIIYFPARIHNPKNIHVGKNVLLQAHVWINAVGSWDGRSYEGGIYINDESVIEKNVQISSISSITIGKATGISQNCAIVDHIHDYTHLGKPIVFAPLSQGKPVVIEDECFLSVNCLVGPGVTIGRHSFIAANSVVNRDIPPYSFAAGSPARVLRTYDHQAGAWKNRHQDDS